LDYESGIQHIKNILQGNVTPVIQAFKKDMKEAADSLAFEKAALLE
jgi:excinuclease ABC subunit C